MVSFSKRSITLAELLVAIVLVGLLVIAVFNLDNYARFHLITSDRRARLQNEASYCIEQIVKEAIRGIGYVNDQAVVCTADDLRIRYDDNNDSPNGQIDSTTLPGGDTLVRFYRDVGTAPYELRYYPDFARNPGDFEVLTNKIVNHLLTPAVDIFTWEDIDGDGNNDIVRIELVLRHHVASSESIDNPQLRMISRVYCRSESLR